MDEIDDVNDIAEKVIQVSKNNEVDNNEYLNIDISNEMKILESDDE